MTLKTPSSELFVPKIRLTYGLSVFIALGVLAGTVLTGLFIVRGLVREQIMRRDADGLYATTLMEQLYLSEEDTLHIRTAEEIGFDAAIRSSRLKGVIGLRFFDHEGNFKDAFPASILPEELSPLLQKKMRSLSPSGHFHKNLLMSDIFIYRPLFETGVIQRIPILEVNVPLHTPDSKQLIGSVQFIVEGHSLLYEFNQLNKHLIKIALLIFVVSGLLLIGVFWLSFLRIQKLNHNLAHHGERLQRANHELALAARVSAVGAVSAHLMHGLKNPLASLSHFIQQQDASQPDLDELNRQDALTAARRMQSMIEHTLEVLSDAKGAPLYELTVEEFGADLLAKVQPLADRKNVRFSMEINAPCSLSSRIANLTGLILENLIENGIQATPVKGTVSLRIHKENETLRFYVTDQGTGFEAYQLKTLFLPGASTREGGSGLGLAISKQIADYLGATLELITHEKTGCAFLLALPVSSCIESEEAY